MGPHCPSCLWTLHSGLSESPLIFFTHSITSSPRSPSLPLSNLPSSLLLLPHHFNLLCLIPPSPLPSPPDSSVPPLHCELVLCPPAMGKEKKIQPYFWRRKKSWIHAELARWPDLKWSFSGQGALCPLKLSDSPEPCPALLPLSLLPNTLLCG